MGGKKKLALAAEEPVISHHGIRYLLDIDKGIAIAEASQRPLFLMFSGINHVHCRKVEKDMAEPAFRSLLYRFVRVQLYVDKVPLLGDPNEGRRLLKRNVQLQIDWFGSVTMPSFAVVAANGTTVLDSFEGLEAHPGELAAFLKSGLKKWEESK